MRLLLDTHVAIWALIDSQHLSQEARSLIAAPENKVIVSAASIWEISIKRAAGRRSVPPFSGAEAVQFLEQAGYSILDVTAAHAAGVERLPRFHTDPFDRLLVAQALAEPLVLLTHDATVAKYSDTIVYI